MESGAADWGESPQLRRKMPRVRRAITPVRVSLSQGHALTQTRSVVDTSVVDMGGRSCYPGTDLFPNQIKT